MKITINAQDNPNRIEVGVAVFKSRLEVLDFIDMMRRTAEMIWPPTPGNGLKLDGRPPGDRDFGRMVPRDHDGDGV